MAMTSAGRFPGWQKPPAKADYIEKGDYPEGESGRVESLALHEVLRR
jgi:hypothetical protein